MNRSSLPGVIAVCDLALYAFRASCAFEEADPLGVTHLGVDERRNEVPTERSEDAEPFL